MPWNPTVNYVDSDIGGSSGSGTSGDPWSSIEYALAQYTANGTDGNILRGKGVETISTTLVEKAGHQTSDPLIFSTWDGDWTLSGGGSNFSIFGGGQGVHWINDNLGAYVLSLTNTGTAAVIGTSTYGTVQGLEISNSSGNGIDLGGTYGAIAYNHIHDIGGIGIDSNVQQRNIFCNYLKNDGTHTMTLGIRAYLRSCVRRNILSLDSTSDGIDCVQQYGSDCSHNSVIVDSGTGIFASNVNEIMQHVSNNLVEIGASGTGIDFNGNRIKAALLGNAVFGSGTKYTTDTLGSGSYTFWLDDNEELSATPFSKSGSDTYANRMTYFAPASTGNVIGGAHGGGGNLDKGAVQSAGGGGGVSSMLRRANLRGGFN